MLFGEHAIVNQDTKDLSKILHNVLKFLAIILVIYVQALIEMNAYHVQKIES